jgi:hypothetical protein
MNPSGLHALIDIHTRVVTGFYHGHLRRHDLILKCRHELLRLGEPKPKVGRASPLIALDAGNWAVPLQMWIAWPRPRKLASLNASVRVGWAWIVPATSSSNAPISIASVNSPTSSETCAPTAWTPNTR